MHGRLYAGWQTRLRCDLRLACTQVASGHAACLSRADMALLFVHACSLNVLHACAALVSHVAVEQVQAEIMEMEGSIPTLRGDGSDVRWGQLLAQLSGASSAGSALEMDPLAATQRSAALSTGLSGLELPLLSPAGSLDPQRGNRSPPQSRRHAPAPGVHSVHNCQSALEACCQLLHCLLGTQVCSQLMCADACMPCHSHTSC